MWDAGLLEVQRLGLEKVDSKCDIVYKVVKSPSTLLNRDYVLASELARLDLLSQISPFDRAAQDAASSCPTARL